MIYGMLVQHGARLEPRPGDASLLFTAGAGGNVELVRALLDAGVPLPEGSVCTKLAAIAKEQGAHDLVPRLLEGLPPSSGSW